MSHLETIERYISGYAAIEAQKAFVLSLWTIGTFLHEQMDSFPYLVITSRVKRSGKTRLSEAISFLSCRPMSVSGATAAALFREIKDRQPTILDPMGRSRNVSL